MLPFQGFNIMNKKNTSLILLFILLNISYINCSATIGNDEKFSKFIEKQTKTKYFLPIATLGFFTLGKLPDFIINPSELKNLTKIEKLLPSISKKDFALTGLKSFFVASSLKKEFASDKGQQWNNYLQKTSLFILLAVYTKKTATVLLKEEKSQNLGTLFEKLIEHYGPIGQLGLAIKGMHNNNEPLLKPTKINFVNQKNQEYTYYGSLFALKLFWEYGIQKKSISWANLHKRCKNIIVSFLLTHAFKSPLTNDYIKKLLILFFFVDGTREFYFPENTESRTLEKELTKSISLEDITANIGKNFTELAIPYNGIIDFVNTNFVPEEEETGKETSTNKNAEEVK